MDNNNYNKVPYETEVSTDAFAGDPVLEKHQTEAMQAHWCEELEASRKERKAFDDRGEKTIKRYADERGENDRGRSDYNVFFANTEIKMAALYARTPVPDIKRRFNDPTDDVSRVGADLLQRNITYELECEGFDAKFKQILFDRLVPGVGVGWARLDETIGEPEVAPVIDPLTGQPAVDPETFEPLMQPVEGSEVKNQLADIDYVPWNDFLWAPCRVWTECRWVARAIDMSEEAVKERFGSTAPQEVISNLSFSKKSKETDGQKTIGPKNSTVATTRVYEIWDKERMLVWWIAEDCEVPLDVQEDRMEFQDFFPTPLPPLGRFTTSSTVAISDFKLVQDQYNELDALNDRAAKKLQAIRTQWVYDASELGLRDLFSAPEFQGIPINNWAVMQSEKGGLKGSVEFFDNTPIVNEYAILIAARDKVKEQIYEIEGIADIMRGASQPYDTATATSAKASLGSTRLSVMMKEVADYVARLLRLKAHMICKFYTPERITERAGTVAQPDQKYVGPALELLKSVPFNHYRLSISTDSLQLPNWNQDKAEATEAVQAITALLGQIIPAAVQDPALGVFGGHLSSFLLSKFKGAGEVEAYLDQFLEQKAQQASAQAQQPKPPSADELKAQAAQQAQQLEMAKTQMKSQAMVEVAQIQADAKREVAALQAQVDSQKNSIKEMEARFEAFATRSEQALAQAQLQIEASRAAHENAIDVAKLAGGQ